MTITSVAAFKSDDDETGAEAHFLEISPALAQIWLAKNTSNRKLKPAMILALVDEIRNGRWILDGNAIRFAGPSFNPTKLLDGQNRLYAILKSGMTVKSLVVFGLPDEAQKSMDSGTKRTVSDLLTIDGTKYAMTVAAAARLAMRIEEGKIDGQFAALPTRSLEFIADNPQLNVSATVAGTYAKRADVPASIVAYTHWRFSKINLDEATAFWRDAAEKVGLEAGDPVLALVNRFAQARRQKERVTNSAAVAAIFRAWNDRRTGTKKQSVLFTSNAEGLPSIK